MLGEREVRDLLILDLAVSQGLVPAKEAAAALQDFWAQDAGPEPSFGSALATATGVSREALAAIEAEVDRLIQETDGDASLTLSRRRGLDRSVFQALSERGPLKSRCPTSLSETSEVALRELSPDRYVDFIPVGEGGMGLVYMALDTELNRLVAFKMIRSEAYDRSKVATPFTRIEATAPEPHSEASRGYEELKARFLQEAWVTGGLEHPGVVPVYELGQTKGGVPYYTMRFVGGQRTLKDALEALTDAAVEARLALLEPFLKLCDTVRYAHSRGVIHRDLKPENVALGEFGEVVLLDWGLAKLEDSQELPASPWQERVQEHREAGGLKTVAGAIGTPGYMAPEAALGGTADVGMQSDLYSLGVVLFEILTGRRPFRFKNYAEYLSRISREEAPGAASLAAAVPLPLSELCASCLSREPGERPASVEAFSAAIRAWQTTSALEREVSGHLRDARAALDAAEAASAEGRLTQVDRAAASLAQAASKMPERREIKELQARGKDLRESGMREREKASGRRLLLRVAALVLVLVAVAGYVIAAKFEARSLERQRDLQRILRLAAAKKVRDLEGEVDTFSASQPDLFEGTTRWLQRADALAEGSPGHARALSELRLLAVSDGPPWVFETPALDWQHQVLEGLVESLAQLKREVRGPRKTVLGLQELAVNIRTKMAESAHAWTPTIEQVGQHPAYDGLKLTVQYGLVPLGQDPESKLFEFAHLGSGPPPRRDPETHRLDYADNSGIVLVLLPAGSFLMGAQSADPTAPNYDPFAVWTRDRSDTYSLLASTYPIQQTAVSAFLIAKHECTQAQWLAMTNGWNPSFFATGGRAPLEQASWDACQKWLSRNGLVLPTETEWEYACRARTDTPWWTGSDAGEVASAAWTYETTVLLRGVDGNMRGEPKTVGQLRANSFGLHDVHGNVWEWCFDLIHPFGEPLLDDLQYGGYRTIRGGSWYEVFKSSRSASRAPAMPDYRCFHLGVRPARRLTTE